MAKYNIQPKEKKFAVLVMAPIVLAGLVLLIVGMIFNLDASVTGSLVGFGRVLILLGIIGTWGLFVIYKTRIRKE